MKKRNLVLLGTTAMLSLALAGTIGAVTASAADIEQSGSHTGTVTVKYSQANSWTVTIPQEITVGGAAVDVSAKNVKIEADASLTVTVKSDNYSGGWKLKDPTQEKSIDYHLKAAADENGLGTAQDLQNEGVVLTVSSGETEGSAKMQATVDNAPATGGKEYTDTLTFEVKDGSEA